MNVIYVLRGTGAADPALLNQLRAYGCRIEVIGINRDDVITRRIDLMVRCA